MRKTAPEPNNLFDACIQHEVTRHARRVAELKNMRARLKLLDEFVPALKAAGLQLLLEPLTSWGGKSLYIRVAYMTDPTRTQKLMDVLVANGMREVERIDHPRDFRVDLKKGRLILSMTVDKPQPAPAAPVATAEVVS